MAPVSIPLIQIRLYRLFEPLRYVFIVPILLSWYLQANVAQIRRRNSKFGPSRAIDRLPEPTSPSEEAEHNRQVIIFYFGKVRNQDKRTEAVVSHFSHLSVTQHPESNHLYFLCILSSVDSNLSKTAPHLAAILARTATRTRNSLSFKAPGRTASSLTPLHSNSEYRPSSIPSFLSRLATFKLSTYANKPAAIDAVAASKCGWLNEDKDRLRCGICDASWVVVGREGMSRDAGKKVGSCFGEGC